MVSKHIFVILALLALALLPSPAHAGGVVTVCDEAHLLAALAGGGTVTFACSGTIVLTDTITIASTTTIDGGGQDITISGNNAVRVFAVNSGVTFNVNKLTIANGESGAGGGIGMSSGALTVSNSTFVGNHADTGGAIQTRGSVTVRNCTFVNNYADLHGGGLELFGGSTIVSNSTFFGNYAAWGAGITSGSATTTVINSTLSGNIAGQGGGIYSYAGPGRVTLKNTIIANNAGEQNCYILGNLTDGGGNLSYPDDYSCPGIKADPMLGPLQNNGGPTWTMELRPGSAAIDGGIDANCAATPVNNLDQRGFVRPQGAHCDIGAFEWVCPSFLPPAAVGIEDVVAIATRWGWTDATPGWDPVYDFNLDDKIDMRDIMLVTAAWGYTCP
ncbi:MAG TPA: right-handed parallel beta-helix repeat-containing protein [Anaerolineae bacterium]|nr:right-handed parallel beta-helix repeat-containing protein [Anaerolineae bacterium]